MDLRNTLQLKNKHKTHICSLLLALKIEKEIKQILYESTETIKIKLVFQGVWTILVHYGVSEMSEQAGSCEAGAKAFEATLNSTLLPRCCKMEEGSAFLKSFKETHYTLMFAQPYLTVGNPIR